VSVWWLGFWLWWKAGQGFSEQMSTVTGLLLEEAGVWAQKEDVIPPVNVVTA